MRRGKTQSLGTLTADTWQKIYETTLTEAATSITISGLNGDADEEYQLICRFVSAKNIMINYRLKPNNDSGNNYGWQKLSGANTTVSASRETSDTAMMIGQTSGPSAGRLCFTNILLYVKSSYIRTAIIKTARDMDTTYIEDVIQYGQSWNNTADNITSLKIDCDTTNGIGIGTVIELYRKIKKA